MSGYDRSPTRNSDKYSRKDRGYDRRDNRRQDDYNRDSRSRRDRDDRDDRRREYIRASEPKQAILEEDVPMAPPPVKKRVPISIEELIQKKEQEKKATEKVTLDSSN